MENIPSRCFARKVAVADLVSTAASIGYISFGLIYFISNIELFYWNDNLEEAEIDAKKNKLIIVTWAHDTIVGLFLIINSWTTYKLYQNTKLDSDVHSAYRIACIWRNVNTIFLPITWAFAMYIFTLNPYVGIIAGSPVFGRGVVAGSSWRIVRDLRQACRGCRSRGSSTQHLVEFPEV